MITVDNVNTAYAELEQATQAFQAAILKFRGVFETETVGLDYWSAGLDDTLFEIREDIDSYFGEAA